MTKEQYLAKTPIRCLKNSIVALKTRLSESDYKAIKHAEGWINDTDYAPIKAQRQSIRDEINSLEAQLKILTNGENGE